MEKKVKYSLIHYKKAISQKSHYQLDPSFSSYVVLVQFIIAATTKWQTYMNPKLRSDS